MSELTVARMLLLAEHVRMGAAACAMRDWRILNPITDTCSPDLRDAWDRGWTAARNARALGIEFIEVYIGSMAIHIRVSNMDPQNTNEEQET